LQVSNLPLTGVPFLYDAHGPHHYTGHKDNRQVDQRELVDVVVRVELAVVVLSVSCAFFAYG
jgi:hypothetical protein